MFGRSKDIWIICAGFIAAMHIGKLPPVVPVLQQELQISFFQAGLLLSLVQGAGMCFALLFGSYVEKLGLRRCIVTGLMLLTSASILGSISQSVSALLFLRVIEGFGFLLVTTSAPALIRQITLPEQINKKMGLWSAYMGGGMGIALLCTPYLLLFMGWQGVWLFFAMLSGLIAFIIYIQIPEPPRHRQTVDIQKLIAMTLKHSPAWLLALMFGTYAGQWLGLVGFLPTIYQQNQISLQMAGVLTAVVAMSNAVGTAWCGVLLQRGIQAKLLMQFAYVVLMVCAIAFYCFKQFLPFIVQYVLVLSFSLFGGYIAAIIFSQAIHFAAKPIAISTTIGLVLQFSSISQFILPPVIAFIVSISADSWFWVGILMATLSGFGMILCQRLFHPKTLNLQRDAIVE